MTTWNELLLPKAPPKSRVNLVRGVANEVLREKETKPLIPPLAKKPVTIAPLRPLALTKYVSKLPTLRAANALATFALSLVIVFFIYSFANNIYEFGFRETLLRSVAVLQMKEEQLAASIFSLLQK